MEASLEVSEKLAAQHPEESDYASDLAGSHEVLGSLYQTTGRMAEAEASFQRAVGLRKAVARAHPENGEYRSTEARSEGALGILYQTTGRLAEAEASFRRALGLEVEIAAAHPDVTEYRSSLAKTHITLGNLHQLTGRAQRRRHVTSEHCRSGRLWPASTPSSWNTRMIWQPS